MGFCKVKGYSGNQSNWRAVFLYMDTYAASEWTMKFWVWSPESAKPRGRRAWEAHASVWWDASPAGQRQAARTKQAQGDVMQWKEQGCTWLSPSALPHLQNQVVVVSQWASAWGTLSCLSHTRSTNVTSFPSVWIHNVPHDDYWIHPLEMEQGNSASTSN